MEKLHLELPVLEQETQFEGESEETKKLREELKKQNIVFKVGEGTKSTEIFWKNELGDWEKITEGEDAADINRLVKEIHKNWPRVQEVSPVDKSHRELQ